MNYLIFDNIAFSLQKAGGISVVWQELIKYILNNKIDNYLCLEYKNATQNIFRNKLDIPNDKIKNLTDPIAIQRYISPKILIYTPSIFHSSYYRTLNHPLVKNVTTVHDFTYEYKYSGLRRRLHSWQKNKAIMASDIVICISHNTANDLKRFCPSVNNRKIRIIYNGVSNEYYPVKNNQNKSMEDSILFVGMRGGYKNFKFTVDAIANTRYKLLICGAPLSQEETKYLNLKLGKNRYTHLGRVNNEELNNLYNSVFCLAYPSSYEGFGIPILEAQRAGCPVIAYHSSSIPEVMGAKSFLLDRLTISDFQDRLNTLKNLKDRRDIIEEGLEYSQKFSWEKMANQYLQLYEELSMTQ